MQKIIDFIFESHYKTSDKIALIYKNKVFSYSQLYYNMTLLSDCIKTNCVLERNEKYNVMICTNNNENFVIALLALNNLNICVTPCNPNDLFDDIESKYEFADCMAIIIDEYALSKNPDLKKLNYYLMTDGKIDEFSIKSEKTRKTKLKNNIDIIFFTSGSTGVQKAVMLSNINIIENIKSISEYIQVSENDSVLLVKQFSHISSVNGELLFALFNHLTIVIYPLIPIPRSIIEYIDKYDITIYFTVPTLLIDLFEAPNSEKLKSTNLRVINFYGGPITSDKVYELIEEYENINFIFSYGLTEAAPRVTYIYGRDMLHRKYSSGLPISCNEIKCNCDDGNLGEIIIKGKNVMEGYYKDPVLTHKIIVNEWLHTGDYGCIKNNYLYVIGRIDNMVTYNGKNVFLEEVEKAIMCFNLVKEAVVEKKLKNGNDILVAKIIVTKKFDIEILREFLSSKIDLFKIPQEIYIVENIDKTTNGKIKRW